MSMSEWSAPKRSEPRVERVRKIERSHVIWPLLGLIIFPVFMCGWKIGTDTVMAIISMVIYSVQYGSMPADPMVALRADLLGISFFIGMGGLVLGAWVANALLSFIARKQNQTPELWSAQSAFGFRNCSKVILVAAFVMGFFVGHLPGWVAQKIGELAPSLVNNGALELVEKMLIHGPLHGRIISILAICLGAPILEELVFRGFLWVLIERTINFALPSQTKMNVGGVSAAILTSLAFAIFHMDPIQSTALLFTAFTLGWLRYVSNSIWPCVLLHFVNNTLAAVLAIALSGWTETYEVSFLIAGGCALLTLALAGICYPFRSKEG